VPALVASSVLDYSDTDNRTRAYYCGDILLMREGDASGAGRQRRPLTQDIARDFAAATKTRRSRRCVKTARQPSRRQNTKHIKSVLHSVR
jgi:hypothetical protein